MVAAMRAADVFGAVAVGTTMEKSSLAISNGGALSTMAPEMTFRSTVGLHPHDAAAEGGAGIDHLRRLLEDSGESVVGVGECGLDYYYEHSPREIQLETFRDQIALAVEFDKTLVIHTRDAWEDTFAVLGDVELPERIILHCFTGGPEEAARCIELGAYLSFSGIVTFKTADALREAALASPIDRILVETDSPFLAPVPLRGKPNTSANVAIVGRFIADLRSEEETYFKAATWSNAHRAFALAP